ncbi:probable ribosome production factor 1 isoform X2 [Nasonia vitripennis]|nr:probable ribosome production factor 1 isoform X2 [Nasonia vitripennis]XP_031787893.1 probable ribosome production factor 1 isoform X2 [Nasonia vitripennis]XP_031787894.1 probable ribosome production factor 1 isoform X2 [Nasonia vitripennis]XP_031787895.1 probable ribosome production factor 1 isoform X2 [Nasonia vitripennis]XP_031787896.1 probable ribosome production factor 1 isoform X2 [Nasonia vitripennis]XP_032456480.1 probable ribosome production factor 1 isoform X2 [Nasonia vitripennis]
MKVKKDLVVNPLSRTKQKKVKDEDGKEAKEVIMPRETGINHIKCKVIRQKKNAELQRQKKKEKKERRKAREQTGEPKQVPHTIESLREKDETMIYGEIEDEDNEEVKIDMEHDEFAPYYRQEYEPKVLITYADNPHTKTRIFGRELTRIIPNSTSLYRNRSGVKKMVKSCIENGYTDIIVINEDQCKPNGMLIVHLPEGPTMHCKLSNVKITPELKRSHKEITNHRPEVVLNNFTTRLGHSVARMFGAIFHHQPEFKGRRVVTFHNQRDYIFFRHHRYEFNPKTGKPRLRELGPRFTLRLRSLQHGTFDSKYGNYEWIIQGRRHQLETSRRKFFL